MSLKRKETKQSVTIVGQSDAQPLANTSISDISIPISFDDWWIQTQNKLNLKPDLKMAVQKHFNARGFTDYRTFNEGLQDFGFKLK